MRTRPTCSVDSHDYLMRLDKNNNSEESHCRDARQDLRPKEPSTVPGRCEICAGRDVRTLAVR